MTSATSLVLQDFAPVATFVSRRPLRILNSSFYSAAGSPPWPWFSAWGSSGATPGWGLAEVNADYFSSWLLFGSSAYLLRALPLGLG